MSIPSEVSERLEKYYRETGDYDKAEKQRQSNKFVASSHNLETIGETHWITIPLTNISGNVGGEINRPYEHCSVKFNAFYSGLSQSDSITTTTELRANGVVRR